MEMLAKYPVLWKAIRKIMERHPNATKAEFVELVTKAAREDPALMEASIDMVAGEAWDEIAQERPPQSA